MSMGNMKKERKKNNNVTPSLKTACIELDILYFNFLNTLNGTGKRRRITPDELDKILEVYKRQVDNYIQELKQNLLIN